MNRILHSNIFAVFFALLTSLGGVTALSFAGEQCWAQIAAAVFAAGSVFLLGLRMSQAAKISRRNKHYRSSRVYFSPTGKMRDTRASREPARIVATACLACSLFALLVACSAIYHLPPQPYNWIESWKDRKSAEENPTEQVTEPTAEPTTEPTTLPDEESTEPEESATMSEVTTTAYRPAKPKSTTTKPEETTSKPKSTMTTEPKDTTTTKPKDTTATTKPKDTTTTAQPALTTVPSEPTE
ncbi:MAG: hypothetical protein LBJ12_05260 [Oscillospiraceae bacterium]|jgi:hypothetical protein|nr:hypothetical protein [Oscillospiraceae bacterium]